MQMCHDCIIISNCDLDLQDVEHVLVDSDGAARGVVLKDGTEIHSRIVLSNATPYVTFKNLMPQVEKQLLKISNNNVCTRCFFFNFLF